MYMRRLFNIGQVISFYILSMRSTTVISRTYMQTFILCMHDSFLGFRLQVYK